MVSFTGRAWVFREGFLEEVTLGLILEGSVGVYQISKVGVGIADRAAAERWGQHSSPNDVQGAGRQEKAWRERVPLERRNHPEEFMLLL